MIKKLLLFILFALLLSACDSNNQPKQIELPESTYLQSELSEFNDYQCALEKINSGDNFVLFVYTSHCSACMSFESVLREFINERKLTIYSIENSAIEKDSWLDKKVGLVPTVLIINNKKIIAQLDPNSEEHKSYFESSSGFASWFDKYILKE